MGLVEDNFTEDTSVIANRRQKWLGRHEHCLVHSVYLRASFSSTETLQFLSPDIDCRSIYDSQ